MIKGILRDTGFSQQAMVIFVVIFVWSARCGHLCGHLEMIIFLSPQSLCRMQLLDTAQCRYDLVGLIVSGASQPALNYIDVRTEHI